MAIVQLIDGRIVENVRITDVKRVGDEGGRTATAHIGENTYPVYYNDVDGESIWYEQMSMETWKMLKGTDLAGFVEGSIEEE
jgi:hypothetical protein